MYIYLFLFYQEIHLTGAGMEIQREDVTIPDNQEGLAFVLYNVLTPEVMPFINSIELMSALRLS